MIDLEAVEKVNGRYGQIRKAEWLNILDTWHAFKRVADAAEKYLESYGCVGNQVTLDKLYESLKALQGSK